MFYQISRQIKSDKESYEIVKRTIQNPHLKVKLNPAIWKEIISV